MHLHFLHDFKLGHNASQTAANINRAWGEGSTNDWTEWYWFLKFCSVNINLKNQEDRG